MKNKLLVLLIIGLNLISHNLYSQDQVYIDSLKNIINTSNNDTLLIKAYYDWGDLYWKTKPDTAIKYYTKSMELSKEHLLMNLPDKEQLRIEKHLSLTLNDLGFIYSRKGCISKALKHYHESLNLLKNTGCIDEVSQTMNNIGFVYVEQENYEKALEYYNKSLDLKIKSGNQLGIATSYNNIGGLYDKQNKLDLAEGYYLKAYKIRQSENDSISMSISLNNIGSIFMKKGKYKEAFKYFSQSLKIQETLNDESRMGFTLVNICKVYLHTKNIKQLNTTAEKAYKLAQNSGYLQVKKRAAEIMKQVAVLNKDYRKAYQYLMEEKMLQDSITAELNKKAVFKQQAQFEYKKKAAVDSIAHVKELRIKETEQKRQVMQKYMFMFGMAISIIFVFLIYRSNRQKKKANILLNQKNEEITAQKDEIETQKNIVINQKEHIEIAYTEITDSINYAKLIQSSALPDIDKAKQYVKDIFCLFQPHSVVSGDFYWFAEVNKQLIITVSDCTGHGVPGAFMSMLGMSLLKEIVIKEQISQPDIILSKLREEVIKALKQKGESSQKDGMDMSLCSINAENLILQWAGANNPLVLVTDEGLLYIKGDKMPIAIHEIMDNFTLHQRALKEGDSIYMFSDGYADQFGGLKGKKFMSKRFKEMLLEVSNKTMLVQKSILEKSLHEWMNHSGIKYEQVDDITVMGIKV